MTKSDTLTPKQILSTNTREGVLYKQIENDRIECYSCGHRCAIGEGKDGICRVRFNRGGKLFVPWGYVAGLHVDPIEKKPFFHALPGNLAMSFGMLGCDYQCGYCQNWLTSQTLRDPSASARFEVLSPEDIVLAAHQYDATVVTSTYNEPLITSEWAVEIFKIAKRYGIVTSYVSNGNGTPEVLEYLRPWVDLYKVDLKGFQDKQYRKLGGVLQTVLNTIKQLHEMKIWIEVVTLVVPGFNDSEEELKDIANFLVSVSPDIPWHVTAFHSDYKMQLTPNTQIKSLMRAVEIGYEAGLHFVYAGNIPGRVGSYENTYCPKCHELLIARWGYTIQKNTMKNGCCPKCKSAIPGFWLVKK
ncbi:MAG: AmmeMemoRadiSam system radical SAM enzyme [Ignavibacteriae bacterium]|nr:AmmeMemoRadiSam system radical SAM enzyme [Ignavibacteriota bacterium]